MTFGAPLILSYTSQLENIVKLEKDRKKARLWLPTLPITKFWIWSRWSTSEELDQNDDENPGLSIFPSSLLLGILHTS